MSAADARRLLLAAHGLLADPARPVGPASLQRQIEAMGFVQVDTINVVERAHHHILMTRFDRYRPELLVRLLERDRTLFEHWTHDAAVIPRSLLRHWLPRFAAWRRLIRSTQYWRRWSRRLGSNPERTLDFVRERIRSEGPLRSKDFEAAKRRGAFWDWKPSRVALEYLWRTGELAITRRDGFEKVYDLSERVFPELLRLRGPKPAEQRAWACRASLERLGVATVTEIAEHLHAISRDDARAWLAAAARSGEVAAVEVEGVDGAKPRSAYALPDWRGRAGRAREAPRRMRLLSPFEPVIHDRARTLRLFGFDYRLECFVPAKQRRFGYYVMPLLEGERLVGRVDPKLQRDQGLLEVRGPWWEPGVRVTRERRRKLERALDLFAEQIGAERWRLRSPSRR